MSINYGINSKADPLNAKVNQSVINGNKGRYFGKYKLTAKDAIGDMALVQEFMYHKYALEYKPYRNYDAYDSKFKYSWDQYEVNNNLYVKGSRYYFGVENANDSYEEGSITLSKSDSRYRVEFGRDSNEYVLHDKISIGNALYAINPLATFTESNTYGVPNYMKKSPVDEDNVIFDLAAWNERSGYTGDPFSKYLVCANLESGINSSNFYQVGKRFWNLKEPYQGTTDVFDVSGNTPYNVIKNEYYKCPVETYEEKQTVAYQAYAQKKNKYLTTPFYGYNKCGWLPSSYNNTIIADYYPMNYFWRVYDNCYWGDKDSFHPFTFNINFMPIHISSTRILMCMYNGKGTSDEWCVSNDEQGIYYRYFVVNPDSYTDGEYLYNVYEIKLHMFGDTNYWTETDALTHWVSDEDEVINYTSTGKWVKSSGSIPLGARKLVKFEGEWRSNFDVLDMLYYWIVYGSCVEEYNIRIDKFKEMNCLCGFHNLGEKERYYIRCLDPTVIENTPYTGIRYAYYTSSSYYHDLETTSEKKIKAEGFFDNQFKGCLPFYPAVNSSSLNKYMVPANYEGTREGSLSVGDFIQTVYSYDENDYTGISDYILDENGNYVYARPEAEGYIEDSTSPSGYYYYKYRSILPEPNNLLGTCRDDVDAHLLKTLYDSDYDVINNVFWKLHDTEIHEDFIAGEYLGEVSFINENPVGCQNIGDEAVYLGNYYKLYKNYGWSGCIYDWQISSIKYSSKLGNGSFTSFGEFISEQIEFTIKPLPAHMTKYFRENYTIRFSCDSYGEQDFIVVSNTLNADKSINVIAVSSLEYVSKYNLDSKIYKLYDNVSSSVTYSDVLKPYLADNVEPVNLLYYINEALGKNNNIQNIVDYFTPKRRLKVSITMDNDSANWYYSSGKVSNKTVREWLTNYGMAQMCFPRVATDRKDITLFDFKMVDYKDIDKSKIITANIGETQFRISELYIGDTYGAANDLEAKSGLEQCTYIIGANGLMDCDLHLFPSMGGNIPQLYWSALQANPTDDPIATYTYYTNAEHSRQDTALLHLGKPELFNYEYMLVDGEVSVLDAPLAEDGVVEVGDVINFTTYQYNENMELTEVNRKMLVTSIETDFNTTTYKTKINYSNGFLNKASISYTAPTAS